MELRFNVWDEQDKKMYYNIWFTDFDGIYFKPGEFNIYDNPYDANRECRLIFLLWSGLNDKDDKALHRCDIIKSIDGMYINEIAYDIGGFYLKGDNMYDRLCAHYIANNPRYWGKIGNRYENPELVKWQG